MAIDASDSPSASPSSSHFSSPRHYYVAVDRLQFKMDTLVDLLAVAGSRPYLPIVLCCSSRDELDAICSTVSNLTFISLSSLKPTLVLSWHIPALPKAGRTWFPVQLVVICLNTASGKHTMFSDLAEAERTLILDKFRQATTEWNQNIGFHHGHDGENVNEGENSIMIVVTDACLPLVASGEAPLSARILINYELPAKKETYMRRMSTCLAADGTVINMVVGGEVVTLKSIEESSGLVIAEMPINISDIL